MPNNTLTKVFEGGFPPENWTNSDWSQSDYGAPHTGNEFAYSNTSGSELTTLQVVASADVTENLKFWYRCEDASYPQSMDVMVGSEIIYQVIDYSSEDYIQADVSLSDYDGQTIQIIFVGQTGSGGYSYGICLDDVTGPEIFVPSCPQPSGLTELNITQSSVDLGWTEKGTATTWNIEYGETGFTQGDGTTISGVNTNPYNLSGLSSGTIYEWYVQSDCGGEQSDWTGPSNFQTQEPVQTIPFSEDWESGSIGTAWNHDAGTFSTIEVNNSSAYNGTYGLEQYGDNSSYTTPTGLADAFTKAQPGGVNEDWTTWSRISVDLTSATNPWLQFWYAMGYQYNNNYNNFWLQVSTDGNSWTDLFSTQTNGAAIAYEKKEIDLSAYNGTAQLYIRFFHNGKYATNYLHLDDIIVHEVNCPIPSNLTESNITTNSVDLGWTENGTATTWNIEYGETGFTQGDGTTISGVNTNPYNLSGLSSGTIYEWYVQSDCGGEQSDWTGPSEFTTACNATTIPYYQNFDNVTAPIFPICMVVENTNDDSQTWQTTSETYFSAPNSAFIQYNATAAMNDWFFTQGLELTGGVTYEVSFVYASASTSYPEKLAVDWGNAPASTSMSGSPIFNNDDIAGGWFIGDGAFTPTSTGTYYVGFHGYSDADMYYLYVDNIKVMEQVASTTWTGSNNDNDWFNENNWDNGIPSTSSDVTIPAGLTYYPTIDELASCNNLVIESDVSGDGSLIGQENIFVYNNVTVERYVTAGEWHGISGPLDNDDFNSVYLNGSPEVWAMSYEESDNSYDYITDLGVDLGDAKGWMVQIEGSAAQTFPFSGDLRINDVGPIALTNSGPDAAHGYNFVGNPYPSAIDWDAASGWTKTNVDEGIWMWNPDGAGGPGWATYITGSGGLNGGSQFISVAQGFFVQVNESSATGSLTIGTDAQVHNSVNFMKEQQLLPDNFIKLKLTDGSRTDESIIRLDEEATINYDGQLDMHKKFSLDDEQPQLYSTANNFMAVNVLPLSTSKVEMDVSGVDGNEMTISLLEINDFNVLYLKDRYSKTICNLLNESYTFTYDESQKDRFTIFFATTVDEQENNLDIARVYSYDKTIRVIIPTKTIVSVDVTNLYGQIIRSMEVGLGTHDIQINHSGIYLVCLRNSKGQLVNKVIIK